MSERVLVIAPHALDEVLGCGGTITKHVANGDQVDILIVFGDGNGHDKKRREWAKQAAALLGANEPIFAGFPENTGDTQRLADIVSSIEINCDTIKPNSIYVPTSSCLHIDHRKTFEAAVTALRPMPSQTVRNILCYEISSSTDWVPSTGWPQFNPNVFINIEKQLDIKHNALKVYMDEMRPEPHARSIKSLLNQAETRGASVGVAAAEAFVLLRRLA